MKNFTTLSILCTLLAGATPAFSATHTVTPKTTIDADKENATATPVEMAEGEVRKIDMPGMTMVFQVKDPLMLAKVKAGNKIRFKAEKLNGEVVVTDLMPVSGAVR